jgi:L-asparaginase
MVPTLSEHASLDLIQLENRDSSELNPSHWTKFAMAIVSAIKSGKFDGIIVTHGTDTMAYSATAVAIILGKSINIPVIFTGSQLPLAAFGTDARFNLENSLNVIKHAYDKDRKHVVAEVMIVFNKVVLRAARAVKVSEADFIAFDTPAHDHLADISATGVKFSRGAHRVKVGASLDIDNLDFQFQRGVVVIDLVPGLEPGIVFDIVRGGKCHALILRSLGAGNVPSLDEYSLIPCIGQATELKIPCVVTTKFVGGTTHAGIYRPGAQALRAGAIESGDLTDVAVQVKVMWLLAQGIRTKDRIQKALLTPVIGEVSE